MKKKLNLVIIILTFCFIFFGLYLGLQKNSLYEPKNFYTKEIINFKSKEFFSFEELHLYDVLRKEDLSILNIWASWCMPCREEHKYIVKISNELDVNLIGLNYKDKESSAKKFINDYGNPYDAILVDNDGTNSIELGAYGVPETFIINNKNKHIIKKYIGPLNKISFNEIKQIIKNEIN